MIDKSQLVRHDAPLHAPTEFYETLSLLKIETLSGPVFFIVDGIATWDDEGDIEQLQSLKNYFYEESQCPTNFIPVEAIYTPDDDDPHGLFEHVRTVWKPTAYTDATQTGEGDLFLRELFPEMSEPRK